MATNSLAQSASQRRSNAGLNFSFSLTRTLLYGATFIFLTAGIESLARANQLQPRTDSTNQSISRICSSIDIRNSFPKNDSLKGCRVVEGFVQILLFDNVNETEMSTRSYPELTEITDYLLLYRVNGLRNVGQLFPNLAVIRGQTLFFQNALVIFEMSSLQEIGLKSLTDITHGLVRIDKNPSLCFVHSIDWDLISHEKGMHFIRSSKPENECPICPGDKDKEGANGLLCPKAPKSIAGDREHKYLCWNRQYCQKICPDNCTSCNDLGQCCNSLCMGGCSNDNVNECVVCRNYSMGFGNDRQCMTNCPMDYYKFLGRRCVSKSECINMRRPIELHSTDDIEFPYKIFEGSCILNCPVNYMNDYENHTCKPCAGQCKKECPGINVDSIQTAKQLRGCTHITGPLEIQIRGGRKVVNELEENLSMIEEIGGYLKVVRSFPLVSLSFLKSLKRIRGESLESQKYVFIVLDNQNLLDLWDWENRTLEIDNKKGQLFFHFNPKLCLSKIRMLQEKANIPKFNDLEVAPNSNGDKIACNVTGLNVTVATIKSKVVLLEWKQFQMDDNRKLLGYIVYSIEATNQNVTLYDGRDACGEDNWRVDDVGTQEDSHNKMRHPLTQLKPYTQYAFYVKTYTIATEPTGAQSKIQYFRTGPSTPTPPLHLSVVSTSSDGLTITWAPPLTPNGNVTHYIVTGKIHDDTPAVQPDYCSTSNKIGFEPTIPDKQPEYQVTPKPAQTNENASCPCDDNKPSRKAPDEGIEASRIEFEDELQNQVYVKREDPKTRRRRRESPSEAAPVPKPIIIENVTINGTDIWESFNFTVYGKTEFQIFNLHHYTTYMIHVQACREPEKGEVKESETDSNCSTTALQSQKTLKKAGADNISKVQISNQSEDSVTISWEQPKDPNGEILLISLEYKRVDIPNTSTLFRCISCSKTTKGSMSFVLDELTPGNYSLRLLAKSRGGYGDYSPYTYFYIPEHPTNLAAIIVSILAVIIVLIVGALGYYQMRQKAQAERRLITTINPDYVPTVYVPDEWEVPRKKIDLVKELGQGSFGMVYEGLARDIKGKPQIRCAIKTVNEHATNRERLEFLNEASVMKAFDTTHVVRLLGVVSQGQPTLVIMELMANGDLKSYLRSHRPDAESYDPTNLRHPPTLKQIYQMAIEIADGMAYLSAKKFVHRDLAARNCMVAEDLTVKIGDFGMTRDIYETDYYRKGTKGLLPVRWMAPESLKDGVFTSSSDVWSYGVVLWEMATLASQPYQGLSNDQVLRYVIDGGVMERPENCPDKLYTLMRYCWQSKKTARPSFLKLCSLLLDDASDNFDKVSFYHSPAGIEARASRPAPSPSQDDQTTPLRGAGSELGYTTSDSQDSDMDIEINIDNDARTIHQFPSISDSERVPTTANGYVSGCPTNGAATTEC